MSQQSGSAVASGSSQRSSPSLPLPANSPASLPTGSSTVWTPQTRLPCALCSTPLFFSTGHQRKEHQKRVHRSSAYVLVRGTLNYRVTRKDGVFTCPCCLRSHPDCSHLSRHFRQTHCSVDDWPADSLPDNWTLVPAQETPPPRATRSAPTATSNGDGDDWCPGPSKKQRLALTSADQTLRSSLPPTPPSATSTAAMVRSPHTSISVPVTLAGASSGCFAPAAELGHYLVALPPSSLYIDPAQSAEAQHHVDALRAIFRPPPGHETAERASGGQSDGREAGQEASSAAVKGGGGMDGRAASAGKRRWSWLNPSAWL